jgi:hypothetical protein
MTEANGFSFRRPKDTGRTETLNTQQRLSHIGDATRLRTLELLLLIILLSDMTTSLRLD